MPLEELDSLDRSLSVPTTSRLVLGLNLRRKWVTFVLIGATDVAIRLGAAATLTTGKLLTAKGSAFVMDMATMPWYGKVYAIAETAASQLAIEEVEVKQ